MISETIATYSKLVAMYNHHSYVYHHLNDSEISDEEFNAIVHLIKKIETENPLVMSAGTSALRVGEAVTKSTLTKVVFDTPMLSMDNIFSKQEATNLWSGELKILEPKIDGLACTAIYEYGYLTLAHTRGDGTIGENITEQFRWMPGVKSHIKGLEEYNRVEIRGELVIPKEKFNSVNTALASNGKKTYANPRNAVAGAMRNTDLNQVKHLGPQYIAYNVICPEMETCGTEHEKMKALKTAIADSGIFTVLDFPFKITSVDKEVEDFINSLETNSELRKALPFEIDGVVIKIDSLARQKELGATSRTPLYMYAFKYPNSIAYSVFRGYEWSMSHTGAYTPVGLIEPTPLAGVTISRATLHNIDRVEAIHALPGDTVMIQRGGEVIPIIKEVVIFNKNNLGKPVPIIEHCRYCHSKLNVIQSRPTCVNNACSAKFALYLHHVVHRDVLDITNIGPETINRICGRALIELDLEHTETVRYSDKLIGSMCEFLSGEWIDKYAMLSTVTNRNLKVSLKEIRERRLDSWRAIAAMAIPEVGKSTAKTLANAGLLGLDLVTSFEPFKTMPESEWCASKIYQWLISLPDIGPVVTCNIIRYFASSPDLNWLNLLNVVAPIASTLLAGRTYAITGSLNGMSRDELVEMIESRGGRVSNSISSKTTALIAGNGGGSKRAKADKLRIKIIDVEEFLKIISN